MSLSEKRVGLRESIRDKIFKWGIEEGGDKLHFNELVDEIFNDFEEQDKEFIKDLKFHGEIDLGRDRLMIKYSKFKELAGKDLI